MKTFVLQEQHLDANQLFTIVMSASISSLRLTTADEVIQCFTFSDRVCADDLPLALEYSSSWSQHIVLREWVTIPTFCEFRGFVVGNKLTAVSQYFSGAYFPELPPLKERLLHLLEEFFETIRDLVGLNPSDYVLDLAVDLTLSRVFVIEINPFGPPDGMGTGTPLFSLSDPNDRAILFGEVHQPTVLRIVQQKLETVEGVLRDGPLRQWLEREGLLAQVLLTKQ